MYHFVLKRLHKLFMAVGLLTFIQPTVALCQYHDESRILNVSNQIKAEIDRQYLANKRFVDSVDEAVSLGMHVEYTPDYHKAKEQIAVVEGRDPVCNELNMLQRDYSIYVDSCKFESVRPVCGKAQQVAKNNLLSMADGWSVENAKSDMDRLGKERALVDRRARWISTIKQTVAQSKACANEMETGVLGDMCETSYNNMLEKALEQKEYLASKCSKESIDAGLKYFMTQMDIYATSIGEAHQLYIDTRRNEQKMGQMLIEIDNLIKNLEKNRQPASKVPTS